MATISLSNNFLFGSSGSLQGRMFNLGASSSNVSLSGLLEAMNSGGSNYGASQIHIMKGTMPTDLSTLTSFTQQSANILATFNPGTNAAGSYAPSTPYTTSIANITTNYVAASAAGTATWFWWLVRATSNQVYQNTPLFNQIVGTIGTIGSGADLEIANTNIASGQQVRIYNLKVSFDRVFTF